MTASVGPAMATPVAPAAARNARGDEASDGGFDEALGATGQRPGHHAARREMEVSAHRWRQQGRDAKLDKTVEAPAAQEPIVGATDVPAQGEAAAAVDMADTTQPAEIDTGAPEDDTPDDADTSLPVHLRAQHAISVMMAIAPASRHGEPDAAQSGRATDHTGSTRLDEAGGRHKVVVATRTLTVERTVQAVAVAGTGDVPAEPTAPASPQMGDTPNQLGAAATKDGKVVMEAAGPARAVQPSGPEPRILAAEPSSAPVSAPAVQIDQGSEQPGTGARDERRSAPEPRRGEAQSVAVKVQVVSQQAAPAPAIVPTTNAAAIVAAIDAQQGLRPTAGLSFATQALPAMRSLKLQLHPAELGMVTANLKAAGDRLSVELHVENSEAYHRLSADSDAIVKSLQTLGYDIDRVSILQPQLASTGVARADAATGTAPFGRDDSSFQAGNSGNGEGRAGGQASGRGGRGDAQHGDQAQQVRRDRAGGGLYI